MNPPTKQNSDKPANSKGKHEVRNMPGKKHTMLDSIREAREKCGNGVKMLPVVRYERKLWFLDERLRQLRNVRNPHDFIDLNEFEIEYFKKEVV
jgi:hypothetical protein